MMYSSNVAKALSLGTLMFASTGYCGQKLNAVWSSGSYSTISPPSGSAMIGHDSGFSLLKEDGSQVFNTDYPDGYSPCMGGDGALYSLTGGCLEEGAELQFYCYTHAELPDNCAVRDKDGNDIATGEGQDDTNFIGIAISIDGYCGVSFELADGVDCEPGVTGFEMKKIHGA
ncbi:hypothetical protein MYU51_012145 [Penicillium brevicompactum]|uniref:uncharacterized protein n=1 Tax=Penicillium brevicompactum TaxID=5074 RepID=UPI00253FE108|nr:uncharacterized protein N7506_002469 [Penicillium brevicompactum]KAJ5344104.1 hypothetical protein N7506_002469 [Penicillium brevicompactum]